MVEKTGIRNEVTILDSRSLVWVGLRVDKASEGRGGGERREKPPARKPAPFE